MISRLHYWEDFTESNFFPGVLTLLFFAVAGLGVYNHEMWRDEFEIFMELRDTSDFLALFPDIQPLPNLYLGLLYPVVKLWPHPAAFQIFHLLVIVSAVFIFNQYSPFKPLQKIFFTFSYFVLFEYGIISREYSMLLLLLFLSVCLITREKPNFVLIALCLILLANHHLYGVFMSLSLFLYTAFHAANRRKTITTAEKRRLIIAGLLLASGALYIIPQYFLLMKLNRFSETFGQPPFFMTLRSVWNAFFPVPGSTDIHFWNTNIFPFPYAYPEDATAAEFISAGNIAATGFSIFILAGGVSMFSGKLPVMLVYLLNTSLQLVFLQYLSVFFMRYQGPLFITFIYSYWLLSHSDETLPCLSKDTYSRFFNRPMLVSARKAASPLLTFILCVQFCTGLFCYIQDARYPFTASYEAAKHIRENELDKGLMVGYVDYVAQAVSGHLGQKIYYPQSGGFGTHVVWLDKNRRESVSLNEVIDHAVRLHHEHGKDILLLLSGPLLDGSKQPMRDALIYNNTRVRHLAEFTEAIAADEQYFLYSIYQAGEEQDP